MAITQAQKELVQATFKQVQAIGLPAIELFYSRLFELDPSLRSMFKTDIKSQAEKLYHTLAYAVNGLDHPEQLIPAVSALGKRHVTYGVTAEHYATVGAALLWTLEKGLGEAWTPEVAEAWTAVYTLLSSTATSAAYEAVPEMA